MIHIIKENKEDALGLMAPIITDWFKNKFDEPTEAQKYAIPLIHAKKNVLVSSSTGSGKTLTGFLSIINELFLLASKNKLEDKVYCIYISPLKALANDINKNLKAPLKEIKELAKLENVNIPDIRVAVRSGDTSQEERKKMLKKPPHIFITTPESLLLSISSPKFKEKFNDVRYIILDEIHDLCSSKRGVMLSLTLEILQNRISREIAKIGLSATQAPIEDIASFLVGYNGKKLRDVNIVKVDTKKGMDLKVLIPVHDMTKVPYEIANEKMYDMLSQLINQHKTTLVFTNTRSGAERVAFKLQERGIESLEAHHSSLSKEVRLEVEHKLKNGELKCVISSTSLELGIDIGHIDLVVQIGSPKSVAKGLQRIGRSGHAVKSVAKGRFLAFDLDDLIECTVLTKCAYNNKIDRIDIPENSLDVLSQIIIGMSLEKRWHVDEAYNLIKNSYCYHNLEKEKFLNVLNYLSGKIYGETLYSKIWFDDKENVFGKRKSSRFLFFTNLGTIPEEGDYHVIVDTGKHVGKLSEKFVENLRKGDIFILGAKTYEHIRIKTMTVYVKDAKGKRPTVPSWTGEMLPRSFDLSLEICKFRAEIEKRLKNKEDVKNWLLENFSIDEWSAVTIVSYFREQMLFIVPTIDKLLIEGYIDQQGKNNIIFHYPFGRRVNDALSRAYANIIANEWNISARISITDNSFMLTTTKAIPLKEITSILTPKNFMESLKKSIKNTELFKQRFRHVATRSFMILRRYKTANISISKQQFRSQRVLNLLHDIQDFSVIDETYNEIFNIAMDIKNSEYIIEKINRKKISIEIKGYSTDPTPFAYNIILLGISDIVIMDDKSALLNELQQKLLEKVLVSDSISKKPLFNFTDLKKFYNKKFDDIKSNKEVLKFIEKVGIIEVLIESKDSIYSHSSLKFDELRKKIDILISKEKIELIFAKKKMLATIPSYVPIFQALYGTSEKSTEIDKKILEYIIKNPKDSINLPKFKKKEIRESLKKLEKMYQIKNLGEQGWVKRDEISFDSTHALEILIEKFLALHGPQTILQIFSNLKLEEEKIENAIFRLKEQDIIREGMFLAAPEEQYILTEDFNNLLKEYGEKTDVIRSHRFTKLVLEKAEDIMDYFNKNVMAFTPFDVYCSVKTFSWDVWRQKIENKEIIYAKFLGERYCYLTRETASLFIGAYRRETLNKNDKKILETLKRLKESTYYNVVCESGIDKNIARNSMEKLINNLYVAKMYLKKEYSRYYSIDIKSTSNIGKLITKIIKKLGPLSNNDLKSFLGFEIDNIPKPLKKIKVVDEVYYYHTENFSQDEDYNLKLVSTSHPFAIPYLSEITAHFGEYYKYIILQNSKIVGVLNITNKDVVEIKSIILNDFNLFPNVLDLLKDILPYFQSDIIVVYPKSEKYEKILCKKEFRKLGDRFVYGNLSNKSFSEAEVMVYILWKQHVHPDTHLQTALDVIDVFKGMRTDFEVNIRCWQPKPLERYFRSGMIYKTTGIYPYVTYAMKEHISLFQSLEDVHLTSEMESVIDFIERFPHINNEEEICEEYSFSKRKIKEVLKNLYNENILAKAYGKSYVLIPSKYSKDEGSKRFIDVVIDIYGLVNVDFIYKFCRRSISRRDINKHLQELVKSGFLVKGFFKENDDGLYCLPKDDLKVIGKKTFIWDFILSPNDPILFYFKDNIKKKFELRNPFIIFEGIEMTGAFKANHRKYELIITETKGEDNKLLIRNFMNSLGIKVSYEKDLIDDSIWYVR